MVGKSRKTVFFQWFVAPEGRKVGSLKRRVRSHLARWEMKNCTPLWHEAHCEVKMHIAPHVGALLEVAMWKKCTPLWREAHFEVNMCKTHQLWTLDHIWKLRCRKSARRCGAKHISKSKCAKHTMFGPLLEVEMSKKCTPLWREAHFEVKMCKTHHARTTFGSWDVEKVHAVVARSTFRSQNEQNTRGSDHFWKLRCRKSARRCGARHISKSKCTKHHMFEPLLEVQMCFRAAGARNCGPCQKWTKREGFVAFQKTVAGVRHLKIYLERCISVAGAVQETCSSEMLGGPGADFLRGVAFWSLRSSGLLKWFCVTGAALRMTWHHFVVVSAVV